MHAAVTTARRSGERDDFVFRLRCRRDERHSRTRFTGADARTRDHRAAIEPLTSSASSTGLLHGSTLLNVA
jgi:hypothetical protein